MSNVNIEELKAKVAAVAEKNKARMQERVEVARLEAILKMEESEDLFAARVRLEATNQQTERLQSLVNECEGIVASVPVFNQRTRANRVWAGNLRFPYGNQVNLMYQLATGILYACAEHKQLLLAHTGLNLELVTQFVESYGTPSYYSRNNHSIEEARTFNALEAVEATNLMQSALEVVIDTSNVTEAAFTAEFKQSALVAERNYNQAVEAIADADFQI